MVPFADYFFECDATDEVVIEIFEQFDNEFFGLQAIDFLVPNEALQFKSAKIKVKTYFTGLRYLMVEWFFVFGLTCILSMTFASSLTLTIAVFILRKLYLERWLINN